MNAAVLHEWHRVLALEGEWGELLERSGADKLFLSWEWLSAWYDVVGKTRSPYVVTVHDSTGRLVGLAPFYRAKARLLGAMPYRGLRLIADYPTGSEYLDWIVERERADSVVEVIAHHLAKRGDWDFVWLPYCAEWTGAAGRLVRACGNAGLGTRTRDETYAAMPLPGSFDEYLKTLSSKRRGKVRQAIRRALEEAGARVVRCERRDDVGGFLDALFDLHGRRWHERGELGTFRKKPTEAAFYRRFAPAAFEKGWLRLAAIVRDDTFVAVQLGYARDGVFYQIQEGFDPKTDGVGNALRASMIDWCIRDGLSTYDFLAGFSEGKARWGASPRPGRDLFITRPGLRSLPLGGIDLWPTGRYLRFAGLGR